MRSVHSFSVLAIVLSFGAITFGARTAHAQLCCSAPICQTDPPSPKCFNCNDRCVDDEETPAASELVYDEVESICYVVEGAESGEDGGCGDSQRDAE